VPLCRYHILEAVKTNELDACTQGTLVLSWKVVMAGCILAAVVMDAN
jgi:hypothetical protein